MNTPLEPQVIIKIKELRSQGFPIRTIARSLGCSPNSVLYHTNESFRKNSLGQGTRKKGQRIGDDLIKQIMQWCSEGVSSKEISRRTGVNYATVSRYRNPQIRKSNNERQKKYTKKEPWSFVLKRERGNKCEICNYDKHPRCLDFHHKIPSEKQFTISKASKNNELQVRSEAAKCVLVCKNCHALIHAGVIEIPIASTLNKS
jgi:hypothetical protein